MASLGNLIFGFMILGICFAGTIFVLAQQSTTELPNVNIGNTSILTNNASAVNQTTELLYSTTSFGTGAGVIVLLILGALIVIGALVLISRSSR